VTARFPMFPRCRRSRGTQEQARGHEKQHEPENEGDNSERHQGTVYET
jgi:hypothetical protein